MMALRAAISFAVLGFKSPFSPVVVKTSDPAQAAR